LSHQTQVLLYKAGILAADLLPLSISEENASKLVAEHPSWLASKRPGAVAEMAHALITKPTTRVRHGRFVMQFTKIPT
jgi:hypothetical protein